MFLNRRSFVFLLVGLCVALLSCLGPLFGMPRVELALYNARMEVSPRPSDPRFVIVEIDDLSLEELGQWPWPRSRHAELIEALTRYGARVIGLDILFAEASDPEEDRRLAEAIARSGRVVLASHHSTVKDSEGQDQLIKPFFETPSGFSQFVVDPDHQVRWIPEMTRSGEEAFSLAILKQAAIAPRGPTSDMLIRFAGPPGHFRTVRYDMVLDGILDPRVDKAFHADGVKDYSELFQGAIVLVGSSAPTQHDLFPTPFSASSLMPGVEIHANVIGSLLRGDAVSEAPWPLSAGFAILLATASALALALAPTLPGLAIAAMFAAAYAALNVWAFNAANLWLWLFQPLLSLAFTAFLLSALRVLSEEREKRRIRQTFSRYVAPGIVAKILEDPERYGIPSAERRYVTVLFSDIEGFTSLSAEVPAEAIARMLNRYLSEMTRCVTRQDGTLDKYIGDGIMAVWGNLGPVDPESDAVKAVQAAIDMQQAAEALQAEWLAEGFPPLRVRIGLHSGEGLVGSFGSPLKMDFTVIGDVVNTASRLEGLNKEHGTSILISGETAALLGGRIPLRGLGEGRVRGKTQRLEIFEVPHDAKKEQPHG